MSLEETKAESKSSWNGMSMSIIMNYPIDRVVEYWYRVEKEMRFVLYITYIMCYNKAYV